MQAVYRLWFQLCLGLGAANAFAASFDQSLVREQRSFGAITVLICANYPTDKYTPKVFIQDNSTNVVSLLYTGFHCGSPNATGDLSRIIFYDGDHQTGSLIVFERQENGAYRAVEEDFAERETGFEQQGGSIPRENFEREFIAVRSELAGANRILFQSYRRTSNQKEFTTEVGYDLQSKAFSDPSAEERARIKEVKFGQSPASSYPNQRIDRVVASPSPSSAVPSAGSQFLQNSCYGVRSPFDIDLFLSAQNDQAALDKMEKADQIKGLRLGREVTVVREDSVHQMYEVRPAGKIETFYVPTFFVGPVRPQGKLAQLSEKDQLVDDNSTRIKEFIQDLDKASGPATLAYKIQSNAQDVKLALEGLKSAGIDFDRDLKKIEAAYKIIKSTDDNTPAYIAQAEADVADANSKLANAVLKEYEGSLKAMKEIQSGVVKASATPNPTVNKRVYGRLEDQPDYAQTEAALNETYQKVRKRLSSSQKVQLRDDERKWLSEREGLKSDPEAFVAFTKKRIETLSAYNGE